MKPNIREFGERSVAFEDGSRVDDVDVVILATGFEFHFPMVEHGKLIPVHDNVVDLYQYMFPTETKNEMSCGRFQVYFGPLVPYVYRLHGPNRWHGAREAIMSVDERVFKATNSSEYKPSSGMYGYIFVSVIVILLLILIF
ncbi:unnamed protein product [Heligmosomoides polygyrus]|uniref:Flavin-containing monooxygenase n=1 Tax=Heligmosomoides polygyrus TaxID=6339 RepID=A0A183F6Q9_HELPZ|nr:unnamed protein product [Heligmosomoides polygyrus]